VQDLAEQDGRRALRAPAQRARRHAPAIARVFVITGPSGVGKGTLIRTLLDRIPELELSVSATTRGPRPGERDGVDYHFLTAEQFDEHVTERDFLEHATYSGNRYGTLRSEIERIFTAGRSCVLELETVGAKAVQESWPDAVTIFIEAPSFAELERRLRERATESSGVIEERLEVARRQIQEAGDFAYVVVNDDVERAVEELDGIVTKELCPVGRLSTT
jgi:guanylate kinase